MNMLENTNKNIRDDQQNNMLVRYLKQADTNCYQLSKHCNIDYHRLNRLEKMSQRAFELSCTIAELETIQTALNIK